MEAQYLQLKEDNYFTVQGWMVTRLHLSEDELIVYAIIYGFSQVKDGRYNGGNRYLREWTSRCKHKIINTLRSLEQKGLVVKEEVNINGVVFNNYYCPANENAQGVHSMHGGGAQDAPINIIINDISNDISKRDNIYIPESAPVSASNDPHCEAMPMPNNSSIPPTPLPSHDAFEECWKAYGRKGSKKKALEQWRKLSVKDAEQVSLHIPHYIKDREMIYRKDFERYLRDRIFLDIVYGKNNECLYDPSGEKPETITEPKQSKWQ